MIKKIRVFLAVAVLVCATALFLDHTGTLQPYLGFLARVQLVPALLALNLGVVAGLAVVTLVLGRVYCSILCPLGLFQDAVARLARRHRKRSYSYTKARTGMRLCVLALFVLALLLGLGSLVALLDPYASFGRMMNALVQPLVQLANNGLSYVAEHLHSYAFALWMSGSRACRFLSLPSRPWQLWATLLQGTEDSTATQSALSVPCWAFSPALP